MVWRSNKSQLPALIEPMRGNTSFSAISSPSRWRTNAPTVSGAPTVSAALAVSAVPKVGLLSLAANSARFKSASAAAIPASLTSPLLRNSSMSSGTPSTCDLGRGFNSPPLQMNAFDVLGATSSSPKPSSSQSSMACGTRVMKASAPSSTMWPANGVVSSLPPTCPLAS